MKLMPRLFSVLFLIPVCADALDENFKAAPGPDLPHGWEAGSLGWAVCKGALWQQGGGEASFAWPAITGAGREVAVEATVCVTKRGTKGWGTAAVAIRQDEENYWHFALVEAPEENGSKHFVELSEHLGDVWNAQYESPTKLTATKWNGANFAWEYNHPYRLKLVLRDGEINGTLSEADGTVRAFLAFVFNARAVDWGAPALGSACLVASFGAFHADVAKPQAPPPAKPFPPYDAAGSGEAGGKVTGFFHTENIRGRDWIIDPNGTLFYFVGTDHATYRGHWCEKLGYSPYARVAEKKYGNETAWAVANIARLKSWGFNTLATGNSPSLRHRGLPYIEFASFGTSFAARDGLCEKTTWTGFPDVFSPDWPRHCDLLARKKCAPLRRDPWLLGYFLDNELEWFGNHHGPGGLFEEAWKKSAENPAKKALVELARQQCGSIAVFNREFGTSFADFAALAADATPRDPKNEKGKFLARDFVRRAAELYFKGCNDALRKADPNHLNLGCRFAGDAPDVWDIAGRYCDIVSVNMYPRIDVDRGVPANVQESCEKWHALAGKPMAVTEWSFPALDAGLPSRHGAGMRVDSQGQRAACFSFFQDFLFREPFIVGSSYFMFIDEPAPGISATFPEDSNYGLITENDEPYPAITAAATAVNREVYRRHRDGNFLPAKIAGGTIPAAWLRDAENMTGDMPAHLEFKTGNILLEFPAGASKWKMSLDGKIVAEIFPLAHFRDGNDFWLHPAFARILARRENARATAIDIAFTFSPRAGDPRAAKAVMRYWIPRDAGGWIASQGLSVENTGSKSWLLGDLYHYLTPKTDGDPAKIETMNDIPNYYRILCGWADRENNRETGCWFVSGGKLGGEFWKDCPDCFHSDIHEKAGVELAPGAKWLPCNQLAFFFAQPVATREAHNAACERIAREISE
jgi:hypothetical protein